jgi:hypothetical protein
MTSFTLFFVFMALSVAGLAAPVISDFAPSSASKGILVAIHGTGFTGATAVSFGGTPAASFQVVSATQINAVVAAGTSGQVSVTVAGVTGSLAGFTYLPSARMITNFGGFWSSTTITNNSVVPDNSHDLLAFQYGGVLFSTGVNDGTLTSHGVTFTAGNYRALPIAGIAGTSNSTNAVYLALAELVDGVTPGFNVAAVSSYNIKTALTDGAKGLNMGTGVTNLPGTAVLTFPISSIVDSKVTDNEPDIILTQIAMPSAGNDVFSFMDAAGNVVGNTVSRDMLQLDSYGTYRLDLYALTPDVSYNTATASATRGTDAETRPIRLVGLRLTDFGLTPANEGLIRSLRVIPSGNSDYAFIGYNANAILLNPNVSPATGNINTDVCTGSSASLSIVATAVANGALSYQWQVSTNDGGTWNNITDGGIYSGANTTHLNITSPVNGYRYHAIVTEAGNPDAGTSGSFEIVINPPTVAGTVSGSATVAYGTNSTTLTLSGQTGSIAQWQSSIDGFSTDITNIANTTTQLTATDLTQTTYYRAQVQSGACPAAFSTIGTITVTPLPIRTGSVKVTQETEGLQVHWTAYDQEKTAMFEIERSTDGIHFVKVHALRPAGSLTRDVTYKWLDTDPHAGHNFYRIKEIYTSGNHGHSHVVKASFENDKAGIAIHGNPVKNNVLNLQLNNIPAGNYQVKLINNLGQVAGQMQFSHSGGSSREALSLPAKIKGGLYKVEVRSDRGMNKTFNVVIL